MSQGQIQLPEPDAYRIFDGEGGYEYRDDLPNEQSIAWSARYGRTWEGVYATATVRSLIERLEAAEAENAQLLAGIAKCRDLIPTPKHLDAEWIAAMGHPLDALAYIAAVMETSK